MEQWILAALLRIVDLVCILCLIQWVVRKAIRSEIKTAIEALDKSIEQLKG